MRKNKVDKIRLLRITVETKQRHRFFGFVMTTAIVLSYTGGGGNDDIYITNK